MSYPITEQCKQCNSMVRKLPRYGCILCFTNQKPEGTFCSLDCIELHKQLIHLAPRNLTELEEEFVKNAHEGHFRWAYDEVTGSPFAMGAWNTNNLFTMEVKQVQTDDGATYFLKESEYS